MPSRRDVLLTAPAALALSGTAGCASSGPEQPILDCTSVSNHDYAAHTVDVTVEFSGELVTWESLTLDARGTEPGGRAQVPRSWPTEPGAFVVRARVDDRNSWEEFDSAAAEAGTYVHLDFDVAAGGDAELWYSAQTEPHERCADAPVATETTSDSE